MSFMNIFDNKLLYFTIGMMKLVIVVVVLLLLLVMVIEYSAASVPERCRIQSWCYV